MPCHVPRANTPSDTGTVTDEPSSDAFTCAGMSSGPSSVCRQYGAPSGTTSLNHDSKSRRTSGEAFSFSVRDAEVCWMNTWCHSDAQIAELGQRALHLARDQVEPARPRL